MQRAVCRYEGDISMPVRVGDPNACESWGAVLAHKRRRLCVFVQAEERENAKEKKKQEKEKVQ